MKNKIVLILGVLFAVNPGYSGSQYSASQRNNSGYIFNGESTEIWSGSWEDLKAVVEDAKEKYGYENFTHLGRNATMLVPANWAQMQLFINRGNPDGWSKYFWDGFHVPEAKKEDGLIGAGIRSFNDRIVKYTNPSGGEVIYDKKTCKIILDEKLGTKNLGYEYTLLSNVIKEEASIVCALNPGCTVAKIVEKLTDEWNKFRSHEVKDVTKHSKNDQYKYAGILFEIDVDNPTKYYIVDGQTGKRMTKNQVKVFPTTMSDMWKNSGPFCVKEDAEIIIPSRSNVFNSDLKSITRVEGKEEVSGKKSLTNNIAKTDADDAGKEEFVPVIDTTRLEGLLKNRISLLSRIVAAGRKITEEEYHQENSLSDSVMMELSSLVETISLANVSDDRKIKMLDDIAMRCMPFVEKISGLLCEAEAKGIATIKTGNISAKLQENVRKIRNSTGKISND